MMQYMIRFAGFSKSEIVFILFSLAGILFLHGAVPYVATPTLGQAIWSMGFSQSFVNESFFSIHAENFGAPEPAAIAFGLSGTWLASVFIRLGLHPADAYSAMIGCWLVLAYISSYNICRYFGVSRILSIVSANIWLTMPVIWAHSGYSMLSVGIALLSFYFLTAIRLFLPLDSSDFASWKLGALYLVSCVVAVFTDGYTFMMFAIGASIMAGWVFLVYPERRLQLAKFAFPVHVLCFGVAYALFSMYIGKATFASAPLDFFRGWGVDITFLGVPTKGVLWLPDLLGLSISRSGANWFGDSSVWRTSFILPLVFAVGVAIYRVIAYRKFALGVLLVAFFAIYMALGPSFKINSQKPANYDAGPTMAASYAVAPTGSSLLSANLPGFNNMRASYRWTALCVFCLWLVLCLSLSSRGKGVSRSIVILPFFVLAFNFPNISKSWDAATSNREQFFAIDRELVVPLRKNLAPRENIAFLPWGNDFLANYVSSALNIVAYNIGGDKNLARAREDWPTIMRQFPRDRVDDDFSNRVLLMLAENEVDAVVLSYMDMLIAAHQWPYRNRYKKPLEYVLHKLSVSDAVDIYEYEKYAIVRLKPEYESLGLEARLDKLFAVGACLPPRCLRRIGLPSSTPSQIGDIIEGVARSTGSRGFLTFGPYVEIEIGSYLLTVYGESDSVNSAFVDVVSDKGSRKIGKFRLGTTPELPSNVLAAGTVSIDTAATDLEIRVFVGEEDSLVVKGYELIPIQERGK